jgi:hypothetical protein
LIEILGGPVQLRGNLFKSASGFNKRSKQLVVVAGPASQVFLHQLRLPELCAATELSMLTWRIVVAGAGKQSHSHDCGNRQSDLHHGWSFLITWRTGATVPFKGSCTFRGAGLLRESNAAAYGLT